MLLLPAQVLFLVLLPQQLSLRVLPAFPKAVPVLPLLPLQSSSVLALFLSPIFLAIPSFATAPALIVVGFYMLTNVVNIDFSDLSEAIPCYICIGAMPFFYSISEGIAMGVISYVAIQILSGKAKEKKISVIMYILAVLFILKYLLL